MLTDKIKDIKIKHLKKDFVNQFGDIHDGVIEFVGIADGGLIEVGYYYGDIKPKNIIVVSSQIGCPSKCSFCELGKEKFVRNLSPEEIIEQSILMLRQVESYGLDIDSKRHKVSFAKSGEPLFNPGLPEALEKMRDFGFSFKVSTVFPSNQKSIENLRRISDFASSYDQPLQLQISLISTSEEYRRKAAGINVANFSEIRTAAEYWKSRNPNGRKVNLSLILTEDVPINVDDVAILNPELFRFRMRLYVPTKNGDENQLKTISQERYEEIKNQFRSKGYEVGDWAKPTPTEQKFGLASNVTLARYKSKLFRNV